MNVRDHRPREPGPGASLRPLVIGVSCLLLGIGVGVGVALTRSPGVPRSAGAQASSAVAPSPAPSIVLVGAATAKLGDDDRAALRAILREELVAERAATEGRSDAGREAPDEPRPARDLSSEQLKVYDRARVEVDDGIARGAWTEDDRAQLRASLATLPPETRIEIIRPLVVSVNEGKVRFAGRGPLF